MPDIFFRGMSAVFKIRDLFKPRSELLDEVSLRPGDTVIDYGCGPGSYIRELSERVGADGQVVAVDIHPLAIEYVKDITRQHQLSNVTTYLSDGLHLPESADNSVDNVLLFDVFHMLGDQIGVLKEIRRVLRSEGTLSVNDPHMEPDQVIAGVTHTGFFKLAEYKEHILIFTPIED
jgi:ubiquinone/menaquinone biosynthesis C-methylase UbiE